MLGFFKSIFYPDAQRFIICSNTWQCFLCIFQQCMPTSTYSFRAVWFPWFYFSPYGIWLSASAGKETKGKKNTSRCFSLHLMNFVRCRIQNLGFQASLLRSVVVCGQVPNASFLSILLIHMAHIISLYLNAPYTVRDGFRITREGCI